MSTCIGVEMKASSASHTGTPTAWAGMFGDKQKRAMDGGKDKDRALMSFHTKCSSWAASIKLCVCVGS